ncbi:hypothetical protein Ancab_039871 [Ancistrocladus abbreviatus]
MAKKARSLMLLGLFMVAIVSSSESLKKPVGVARKEDIPFIECQVCQKLASELHRQVQNKQANISPKQISEYQIIEITENICNLKKEEADWILKIDIVEQGDKLKLVDQDVEGQCNSECKTIERACLEIIGDSDTDVAEYLYKSKPELDSFVNYLCEDLTRVCSTEPPPVPKDRAPGEPFIPKPTKDAEMEKILRSMEGMPGAPGMKMYSREELMNMKNFGGGDPDEEEDDNEEGTVLREKENKKVNWKQNIRNQVLVAGEKLKRNADKVAHRLRRWWRSKKSASSKGKSNGKPEL